MRFLICLGVFVLVSLNFVFSAEDVIDNFFKYKICAGCIEDNQHNVVHQCSVPTCCSSGNSSPAIPRHDDIKTGKLVNNIVPRSSDVKPSVYCIDANKIELQWNTSPATFYSVEYYSNRIKLFTPLTRCGQEIIRDLSPNTLYTIILHSFKIVEEDLILEHSDGMKIKTRGINRIDPVQNFTVIGYKRLNDVDVEISVEWNNSKSLACSFQIVAFGKEMYLRVFDGPFSPHKALIPDFGFNQNYSIGIMAESEYSVKMESEKQWLNNTVPSCFEIEQPYFCVPEEPKNLTVEEYPDNSINIYWERPIVDPEYYVAELQNDENDNNVTNDMIPGNRTNFTFTNIILGYSYKISLTAVSKNGASNAAVIHRQISGKPPYIDVNQSRITLDIIIMLTLCVVVTVGIISMLLRNYFTKKTNGSKCDDTRKTPVSITLSTSNISDNTDKPDNWELDSSKLKISEYLGEGEFGVVRKGSYRNGDDNQLEVAIKMLRDNATEEEKRQLAQEIELMKSVPVHRHLVSLIGCITKGNMLLVTEFCTKGNLQTYLRNAWKKLSNIYINRQIYSVESNEFANNLYELCTDDNFDDIPQPKDLISFARQITVGMEYLSSIKLIHRDLAARNILVCEKNRVKISDFGLSRDVYYNNVYQKMTGGKLPLRWMALECMTYQIYTIQSDVWSFGVLLWEIVTMGCTPYPGIATQQLLGLLQAGYRMEKPPNCNQELYAIMLRCWKETPSERPSFEDLRKCFEGFQEEVSHYINLDFKEINTLD